MSIPQQYTRLATLWPRDLLRPTRSFSAALLARRAALTGEAPPEPEPAPAPKRSWFGLGRQSEEPAAPVIERIALDATLEARNVAALDALLGDRFASKYPLTDRTLKPQSRPLYYEKLRRELDEAPTRTWMDRVKLGIKGFFSLRRQY